MANNSGVVRCPVCGSCNLQGVIQEDPKSSSGCLLWMFGILYPLYLLLTGWKRKQRFWRCSDCGETFPMD